MNRYATLAWSFCLGSATLLTPVLANATDGEAIIQQGGANPAAMACMACHGVDGKGLAEAGYPRLAGLPEKYLLKQLGDFRAGKRVNPTMQPVAQALGEDEMAAVAKAYAARPAVQIEAGPVERPAPGTGAWIAVKGLWDRNVPECILCHGPSGVGVGDAFPPLAGQSAQYIESQLKAWQGTPAVEADGKTKAVEATLPTRSNDPNGLMQHIAAALTDDEVKAVAEYFASLGEAKEPVKGSQYRLR